MMTKYIISIIFGLMAMSATAQVVEEDLFFGGRPECDVDFGRTSLRHEVKQKVGSQSSAPIHAKGERHVPVVLVAFADRAFTVADTDAEVNAYYQKYCNGTLDGKRYTGHGSYGAVRDYFVEMSDSAFLPVFDVIGPVTLSGGYAEYGQNSSSSKDLGYSRFRSEALSEAVAQHSDWDMFDSNNNGKVDIVFFVYAGPGENTSKETDDIWPKESTAQTTISGVVVENTGCTSEMRVTAVDGKPTLRNDGIGVFVHELSHALGLPDFYDTKSKAYGMDFWSVMDYGEYGNAGYYPVNYTAYERDFMGWQSLVELKEPQIVTIKPFADGGVGYKIVNEANPNEYYVLENRQAKGWDSWLGTKAHGLQVTHVDYDLQRWSGNTVNTDCIDHQHMSIISASGKYLGIGSAKTSAERYAAMEAELFPGSTYNFNLTDESIPAATTFVGGYMHRPIREITENADGTITLYYCTFGQLEQVVPEDAQNITEDGFTMSWADVEHATQYECELYVDAVSTEAEPLRTNVVTNNSIAYTDLPTEGKFTFRVRAKADAPEDYLDSEWSREVAVETIPVGIEQIVAANQSVDVYDLSGLRIARCKVGDVNECALGRGIYILRFGNGITRKMILK